MYGLQRVLLGAGEALRDLAPVGQDGGARVLVDLLLGVQPEVVLVVLLERVEELGVVHHLLGGLPEVVHLAAAVGEKWAPLAVIISGLDSAQQALENTSVPWKSIRGPILPSITDCACRSLSAAGEE